MKHCGNEQQTIRMNILAALLAEKRGES